MMSHDKALESLPLPMTMAVHDNNVHSAGIDVITPIDIDHTQSKSRPRPDSFFAALDAPRKGYHLPTKLLPKIQTVFPQQRNSSVPPRIGSRSHPDAAPSHLRERTVSSPASPRQYRQYDASTDRQDQASYGAYPPYAGRTESVTSSSRQASPSPNGHPFRASWNEVRRPGLGSSTDSSLASRDPSLYHSDSAEGLGNILTQKHLHPGEKVALLSHAKTLELYRANAKKSNDPEVILELATLMVNLARELPEIGDELSEHAEPSLIAKHVRRPSAALESAKRRMSPSNSSSSSSLSNQGAIMNGSNGTNGHAANKSPAVSDAGHTDQQSLSSSTDSDLPATRKNALYIEAAALLKRLAHQGHVPAQAMLADLYLQGVLNAKGKKEWDKAFPLFQQSAKQGDTKAAYLAGQCCEHALGTRKDWAKAVQWYRRACADSHPGAMYRLGTAEMKGELGMTKRPKEGFKWLKRTAELADHPDPPDEAIKALYELGLLHEHGIEHVVFVDYEYAAECFAKAAAFGHASSAFKLGECYEYGTMGCPQDPALSIHYYNISAQQNHPESCFALTAWYLTGCPGILPQSDTEAFLWAKKAAAGGLIKAEYALGHFTENGIGTIKDATAAKMWYEKAAAHGDERAVQKLSGVPQEYISARQRSSTNGTVMPGQNAQNKKDADCIIS